MGLFSRDKYLEKSVNLLEENLFDLRGTVAKLHSRVNTLEYEAKPAYSVKQLPTEDLIDIYCDLYNRCRAVNRVADEIPKESLIKVIKTWEHHFLQAKINQLLDKLAGVN